MIGSLESRFSKQLIIRLPEYPKVLDFAALNWARNQGSVVILAVCFHLPFAPHTLVHTPISESDIERSEEIQATRKMQGSKDHTEPPHSGYMQCLDSQRLWLH